MIQNRCPIIENFSADQWSSFQNFSFNCTSVQLCQLLCALTILVDGHEIRKHHSCCIGPSWLEWWEFWKSLIDREWWWLWMIGYYYVMTNWPLYSAQFQIVFESVVGEGVASDIAIDDITMHGKCTVQFMAVFETAVWALACMWAGRRPPE